MMNLRHQRSRPGAAGDPGQARSTCSRQLEPDGTVTLGALIDFIAEKDPASSTRSAGSTSKLFDTLVQDLETLRLTRGEFLAAQGEPLDAEALLGLGRHARPGRTRLSIISTKFLGDNPDVQFWVSQLLVEMGRWASRSPRPVAPGGRCSSTRPTSTCPRCGSRRPRSRWRTS